MSKSVVAALQIGSLPGGKAATLEQILSYEDAIIEAGAQLVVMPEALLGGYPKGEGFGTQLGYRLPEGRDAFARYFANAVEVPGEETEALAGLAARTGANLVLGVIERAGSTLYCTALYFDPQHGLVGKHRKLMPTGTERLIWGKGDGSTLPVLDTQVGRVGAVICWENMMPLLRTAMYAKGVEVWCAPTVDEREMWQVSMRHIAHEGRCFVVSACQVQASPQELGLEIANWPAERPLIAGGSLIVGPMGEVLAGPLVGRVGLLTAQIDTDELVRARYDYDVVGHYARPDVFELTVDERAKAGVRFI
ncbi:carbon-nitrogen hydrolase family protein [Pseudomonas chlororaphis]|uniref:Aliphatic nitrilase NitA n=1 Tax=Pseudomonas chlororaphis TaxID=587753 RepID=A0AAX3FMC0_9PSED|nr:carbon-nitrogen hydrolase family protein [Pseudomonas chlororaphis]AZC37379.1 Plant-induced nitrilase, hydrolyses beta-cyano-L-alanine [Pseudomonas chlororaphis subsp. piscium]AZC43928.1 Plant-induced nitrilase, hydrolyses beta-cyano-L-alanine [Pseudomonas chlororaphis subsp. piscium]WDG75782.1 carbon-nitrogen hydrolase family protein [Pseudomonas chlororaphis]WDH26583.1 carbon-nitrogen hydrolase family protein [Pseudomonas chlororaphis]WDH74300.1 carbon-nitrogen hydrolase family protein [P